jgi:ribonuclease D
LAMLRPKRVEELGQLRRLDAGARQKLGDAIVRAVARAEALDESELPERPKRPLGSSRDTLAALMAVAVGEIARREDLPANLLIPRAVIERIAREVPSDRESLERSLELRPWRLALLVDPLWRLLTGDASLAVEGYAEGNPKIRFTHESPSR